MSKGAFESLLDVTRDMHQANPTLQAFCPFPDDLQKIDLVPKHVPAADLMYSEAALDCEYHSAIRDAFVEAGPEACWRETYKETDIGQDFMNRFACYCLIGEGGQWSSSNMSAYVVYMPAGLHYPWHHHPAEEMYFVIAGEGEFHLEGEPSRVLREGQFAFHGANQPHALTTHDHPIMVYVLWRNNFGSPPVWTERSVGT